MIRWLTLLLVGCVLMTQGCTYRAWYEEFQKQQRDDCYKKYISQRDIQECLDKINMTYEEYERIRKNQNETNTAYEEYERARENPNK